MNTAGASRAPAASPARGARPGRWELLAFLELCGLCGLVVTQPVLDVVGRSPDFLVLHRLSRLEVVLLAAAFAVLPPVLLWLAGVAARLAGWWPRRAAHAVTVTILLVALAMEAGKQLLPLRGRWLALLAGLSGLALSALYLRFDALRRVARVAAVGPLVFALLFLLVSPVSGLVLPGGGPAAGADRAAMVGRPVPGAKHPPIVLVFLDELPLASLLDDRGRINARAFPNFAWLAERSTWYPNATAVNQWTKFSIPASLVSEYPLSEVAPHYQEHPRNLFTLLAGTYEMNVHENSTQLCPPSVCPPATAPAERRGLPAVLSRGGKLLQQQVSPKERQEDLAAAESLAEAAAPKRRGGHNVSQPARFEQFLAQLTPSEQPKLHFLHLLLPHRPWRYLPSGHTYRAAPYLLGLPKLASRWESDWWARLGRTQHLLQLAYTDRLLGELLRALVDRGLFDEALVIVTADHGVSFQTGTLSRSLTDQTAPWLLWVPLFIKAPGQRDGRVDERNWQHVDLLPTIADYAGVRVPWKVMGVSALDPPREGDGKLVASAGRLQTLDGPSNLDRVLRGGPLPASPRARPRLGGKPGRGIIEHGSARPELAGRRVSGFRVVDGGPAATVARLSDFQDVQPSSGEVPVYVHGTMPPGTAPGTLVAIALNGKIGAVVPVMPEGQQRTLRFAGIVPESLLTAGANRLELFFLEPDGSLRRLALQEGEVT